jgi:gliding motility-associated-like protein
MINVSKKIDVLSNDRNATPLSLLDLVRNPKMGYARVSPDRKLLYWATDEVNCSRQDSLQYRICNGFDCDTSTLKVWIRCPKVKIYSGFSPNDDNVNDVFVISNIELYPDNEVTIFNRFGNQVFFKRGYANDWKGIWQDRPLPDGTYFYFVELKDAENTVLTGYLQLNR